MISTEFAAAHDITIKADQKQQKFVNINGDPVPTSGIAEITINPPTNSITTSAVVSPASTDNIATMYTQSWKRISLTTSTNSRRADNIGKQMQTTNAVLQTENCWQHTTRSDTSAIP